MPTGPKRGRRRRRSSDTWRPQIRHLTLPRAPQRKTPQPWGRTLRPQREEPRPDVVVLPRHRLPPILCEAFGGNTGLVDVRLRIEGASDEQPVIPQVDRDVADLLLCLTGAYSVSDEPLEKSENVTPTAISFTTRPYRRALCVL